MRELLRVAPAPSTSGMAPSPSKLALTACQGSDCAAFAPVGALPSDLSLNWGMVSIAFIACSVLIIVGPVLCCVVRARLRHSRYVLNQPQRAPRTESKVVAPVEPVPIETVDGIYVVHPDEEGGVAIFCQPSTQAAAPEVTKSEGQKGTAPVESPFWVDPKRDDTAKPSGTDLAK